MDNEIEKIVTAKEKILLIANELVEMLCRIEGYTQAEIENEKREGLPKWELETVLCSLSSECVRLKAVSNLVSRKYSMEAFKDLMSFIMGTKKMFSNDFFGNALSDFTGFLNRLFWIVSRLEAFEQTKNSECLNKDVGVRYSENTNEFFLIIAERQDQ